MQCSEVCKFFLINRLGDSIAGHHYESKLLISSICPHLSPNDRAKIEDAIFQYKYNDLLRDGPPEWRFNLQKNNRQHQLQLLLSFPDGCLSPTGKERRDVESRAFPRVVEEDQQPIEIKVHTVGPRVTSKELAKGSDQNILNLLYELNDETQWDHPRRNLSSDLQWIGGSVQLSREFAELVKVDPERFIRLLPKLKPEQHESYVGAGLVGLSETDFPAKKLIQIIEGLDIRGFSSEHFYEQAARALGKIATKDRGLPTSILAILQSWLQIHTQPLLDYHQSKEESNSNLKSSLLFEFYGSRLLPGGRGTIVRALADGYLRRDSPDLMNWAEFIRSQLGVEQHPEVWVDILTDMPPLLNGDRIEATKLFDLVIHNCPEILEHTWGIYCIGRVLGRLKPIETSQDWLKILQARNSSISRQGYGELIVLNYFHYQDEWSIGCIREQLKLLNNEAILCGIAHAASHLWVDRKCQRLATEILTTLASSSISSVKQAVANFFRHSQDQFELNRDMQKIIHAVCKDQDVLLGAANTLIKIIEAEDLINFHPEIVAEVCKSVLGIGKELTNTARPSALIAKSLTSLVIQLHRQPLYRKDGLLLFEKLLDLNLREAQVALETLDRKPSRSN